MSCDNCNCTECMEKKRLEEFSKRITACDLRRGIKLPPGYVRDFASDTLIPQHKDKYIGTGSD